jgi:preprotein translocase subunit SecA
MRIFGSERISGLMSRIGMAEGVPIEHKMVSRAIERAQKQVEGQNFSIRKHLLEYDDVMNKQRASIYNQRKDILHGKNMKEFIQGLIVTLVEWIMDNHTNKDKAPEDWDVEGFRNAIASQFGLNIEELNIDWDKINYQELIDVISKALKDIYKEKDDIMGETRMREFERIITLQILDSQWKDHLLAMDYLKEGIGLRGYAQKDPLIEYKKESYDMFQAMMDRIEEESIRYLFLLQPVKEEEVPERREQPLYYQRPQGSQAARVKQARSLIPKKRKKKKKKK